jgi:thioredoxin reductase
MVLTNANKFCNICARSKKRMVIENRERARDSSIKEVVRFFEIEFQKKIKLTTKSLILAQDERWRRA